jgi:hypothetical protein
VESHSFALTLNQVLAAAIFLYPTMTLPKFTLDYHSCSIRELQQFVEDRTGWPSRYWIRKLSYIYCLNQMDKLATFPFLNLPPELCNLVYEELLLPITATDVGLARPARRCPLYAQILATSKLIRKEAGGILYGTHPLRVTLHEYDVEIARTAYPLHYSMLLLETFEKWPEMLRCFHHVEICVELPGSEPYPGAASSSSQHKVVRMNQTVWSLAVFLKANNPSLKRVSVSLKPVSYGPEELDGVPTVLSPLLKLGSLFSFDNLPQRTVDALRCQLQEFTSHNHRAYSIAECRSALRAPAGDVGLQSLWESGTGDSIKRINVLLMGKEVIDSKVDGSARLAGGWRRRPLV